MKFLPTFPALWRWTAALLLLAAFPAGAEEPAPEARHEYVEFTIAKPAAVKPFEKADTKAVVDPAALERLVKRAEQTHSDALVVLQDGKLVGDWRFGKPAGPIEAMSATKSIVSLAVGRLVATGRLRLDDPITAFYPEWKGTPKEKITLRHLLDHTSGLQTNPTTEEIYASRDIVRLALDASLVSEPGTAFVYSNKAVNLLAGIVEKAAGRKLDEYLRDEVFAPLGMTRFSWMRDASGNPHGMAGLQIDPLDLARIGQLMLDEGTFQGRPVSEDELVNRLDGLFGAGQGLQAYLTNVRGRGLAGPRTTIGPLMGYSAQGYLGQYLAVLPASRLVAVRMIRAESSRSEADAFTDFLDRVQELRPASAAAKKQAAE